MAQRLVRFVNCAVRTRGKTLLSQFSGSKYVVHNLNFPKCHRYSKSVVVENQYDLTEHGTSESNDNVKKPKSKQETGTSDALKMKNTNTTGTKRKTNGSSLDQPDKLKPSTKVKKSVGTKSEALIGDKTIVEKHLENSSKLETKTDAILSKTTEKLEASSENTRSKTNKASSVMADKSTNPEVKTTKLIPKAKKATTGTGATESLLKTDLKPKTKKSAVSKIDNKEIQAETKRSSPQVERKTTVKKANTTKEAIKKSKKLIPDLAVKKTPRMVTPITECDLIEGRIQEDKKESFKMFVEDLSLPYLPYVSSVLRDTQSEQSKFFLEHWKVQMIEELGDEGFAKLQKDTFRRGHNFHACVQDKLSGKDMSEIQLQEDNQGHWQSIEKVFNDVDDVIALEKTVYHDSLLYNGKFDCLAVFRGELCVIDWKTSKKPKPLLSSTYDNPIQVAAYMGAINSIPVIPGVDKVTKAAIVVAYNEGLPAHVHMMDIKACQKYWTKWLDRLKLYWTLKFEEQKNPKAVDT